MAHGKKDYSVYMRPQYVNIYYMLTHNYYLNMHVRLLKYISCLVLSCHIFIMGWGYCTKFQTLDVGRVAGWVGFGAYVFYLYRTCKILS